MPRRAIIIHGWQGNSLQGWYPWLGSELKRRGFDVSIPAMPDTNDPKPDEWVATLSKEVAEPNKDVYLVGHSAGANTIMKYLGMKHRKKIGGAVLVAPWPSLNPSDRKYGKEMCERWLDRHYDWETISGNAKNITAIFSTNDPYVAVADADVFRNMLRCNIIIEKEMKHMNESAGIMDLPSALRAILEQSGLK